MHQHWIELLPETRALLAILILTARTILALRALRSRGVPTPLTPADAAASSPATTTSTQPARPAPPDRFSRTAGVMLRAAAQVCSAGLAVLDWLTNSSFV